MRINLREHLWMLCICFGLWPVLAFTQSSPAAQNLMDCCAMYPANA
jgi:hypothetical protein